MCTVGAIFPYRERVLGCKALRFKIDTEIPTGAAFVKLSSR